MNPWKKLQERFLLSEDLQYRGDTFVTLKDLTKLFVGSEKQPGFTGNPGRPPNPNGGVESGNYEFNPEFLALGDMKGSAAMWQDDVESALAVATTDSAKTVQSGNPQGGTMVKKNYGGSISMQNAPGRPHHNDRLGSSMDRYDVLLVADFEHRMNRKGLMVPVVTLKKVAWSPSIGSQKEREERLLAFLNGRNGPGLSRRPQPHRPVWTKDDEEHQDAIAQRDRSYVSPDEED